MKITHEQAKALLATFDLLTLFRESQSERLNSFLADLRRYVKQKPSQTVLVCGGRHYDEPDYVHQVLDDLRIRGKIDVIIEGGATGADSLARIWAKSYGIHVATVTPYWDLNKNAAGPIRNSAMLKLLPDLVVAFPGGNGTKDMVAKSVAAGVRVLEVSQ